MKAQLAQAKVDQILSARERMRPFEDAAQKLDDETRLLTTLKLTLRQREIDFQVPKKTIEILNKAVRVFDHMRNDHQEEGSHAFGYDYRQAVNRIQAMPADYTPMQIARKLVYNTEVASK